MMSRKYFFSRNIKHKLPFKIKQLMKIKSRVHAAYLPRCSPKGSIKRIITQQLRHHPASPPINSSRLSDGRSRNVTDWALHAQRRVCAKVITTTLITIRKICTCHRLLTHNIPFSALISWEINLALPGLPTITAIYQNRNDLWDWNWFFFFLGAV